VLIIPRVVEALRRWPLGLDIVGSVEAASGEAKCLRRLLSPLPAPNKGLQPTASSVRSCLAPASSSGGNLAFARLSETTRHVGSLARVIRGVLIKSKSW